MDNKIKLDYPDGTTKIVKTDIIQELYYSLAVISKKYSKAEKNAIKEREYIFSLKKKRVHYLKRKVLSDEKTI